MTHHMDILAVDRVREPRVQIDLEAKRIEGYPVPYDPGFESLQSEHLFQLKISL